MHIISYIFLWLLCLPSEASKYLTDDDNQPFIDIDTAKDPPKTFWKGKDSKPNLSCFEKTLLFRLLIQSTLGKGFTLRLDLLVQCQDINPNPGPSGRPSVKLLVNFIDPLQHCEEIKEMSRNPTKRQNVTLFAKSLLQISQSTETSSSQTKDLSEAVCELPKSVSSYDILFMISNLWSQIDDDDQVKMILFFCNNFKYDGQCDVFSLLGNLLNQDVYE